MVGAMDDIRASLLLFLNSILTQELARPGFQFRDRDYQNPSLNIETETETMNLAVSVTRPRLKILESQRQDRDQDYESCSLSDETETMNLAVSLLRTRLRPRIFVSWSRLRLRLRTRLNAYNCVDIWAHLGPSIEINHYFLIYY